MIHHTLGSVGHGDWSYFSATCWFFGRNLYDNLKYPIGLVATDWGGTPVEAWSSPDALKKCGMDGKHNPQVHKYVKYVNICNKKILENLKF